MRNADRLLGVIYREVSLEKLFKDFENYQCNTRDFGMNINSPAFLRSAVVRYTHKYPNNYSLEEVENILKVYAGYGNVYIKANGNAIGLVFYCAEQLFSCIDGAILVKFDELLEWDGICNKIDANILIAAYASKHSNADLKKTGAVLKHDNFSLQKILHNGAADNHMHLKASGYCADMSWACLMLCSFNEDYILKTFIKESKMIERNFAISVSSALLLIKKIKFIRLYLKSWLLKYSDLKNLKRKFIVDLLNEKDDISFCVKISRLPIQYVINCIEHEYSSSNNIDKYFLVERNFQKQIFKLVSVINDVFLIHLFNIYLAAISQIRFFLVQDNEGMGFKKFKLNENVKDRLISLNSYSLKGIINEKEAYATVFDRCYKSQICKCAEFRIAPKSSIEDFNLTFKLIEDYSIIMWKKYYDVSKLN